MGSTACPPAVALEQFLEGTLNEDASTTIGDHLETCPLCQAILDRMSRVTAVIPVSSASVPASERGAVDTFLRQVKAFAPADSAQAVQKPEPGPPPEIPGYDLIAELGRGGMGVVYKAVHKALNRTVAVKMILSGVYPDESDRQRFRAEAEAIARLQHPNIVQLFEVGEAGGRPFLSLEYVPGGTLAQRANDRPQQPTAAARLVERIARAVEAAHSRQIIHRDLKPHNVLLAPALDPTDEAERTFGIPKLTDFGLSKRMDHQHTTVNRTVSGTPSYMAPEQVPTGVASGVRPSIGPGTDIYALGAMLYHLLTGRPPFAGPDWLTTLLQVVRRDPVPVRFLQPSVPRDLETICLKCLEKDPARRYPSAGAFADDLDRFLSRKPIVARPVGPIERTWKWARRHPVAASAVGFAFAGLLSAVVGLAVALHAVEGKRDAEARAVEELRERERAAILAREEQERLRLAAEQALYLSRISQANLLWRDSDLARTRQTLDDCAVSARRWEWGYLNRLAHDGLISDALQPGYEVDVVTFGDGWVAAAGSSTPVPGLRPAPATVLLLDNEGNTRLRAVLPVIGRVVRLAATPTGNRLLAVAGDPQEKKLSHVLVAWEVPKKRETGLQPALYTRKVPGIWNLSPDGTFLAVASPTGVSVQGTGPADPARVIPTGASPSMVEISEQGTRIATLAGGKVQVWDAATGGELASWAGEIGSVALSPRGDRIAYYDPARPGVLVRSVLAKEGAAMVLPLDAGPGPAGKSIPVRFSRDGGTVIASGPETIRVWEFAGAGPTSQSIPNSGIRLVQPSRDGKRIATTGEDGTVRIWSFSGGRPTSRIYRGHAGPVRSIRFSPDGHQMLTGGRDGAMIVWDLTRPQDHFSLPDSQVERVSLTPDGRVLELQRGRLVVRDRVTGELLDSVEIPRGDADPNLPTDSAFAAEANLLVTIGPKRRSVDIWSTTTPLTRRHRLTGHKHPITAVACSADGKTIVTGSAGISESAGRTQASGEVCIWDGVTGQLRHRRDEANLCVCSLAVARDGRLAAVTTGWPGWNRPSESAPPAGLRLLVPGDGSLRPAIAGDPKGADTFTHLAFHPGNSLLAAIGTRHPGTVVAFDLAAGKATWEARTGDRFAGLTFFPDGSRVAAANRVGSVTVLDASTGGEAIRLTGEGGTPLSSATPGIDSAGRFLAVPGPAHVTIWESAMDPAGTRDAWRRAATTRSKLPAPNP